MTEMATTNQINVRVTPEQKIFLKEVAEKHKCYQTAVIRRAIQWYMEQYRKDTDEHNETCNNIFHDHCGYSPDL